MSVNVFGHLFRFTSWGESHGPAIGAVVDGCPPRIPLAEEDIQVWLDRRRPGTGPNVSPRREPDRVRILSGTFEGRTTGTPISLVIDNVDARPGDYAATADAYRPGHADCAYEAKYGIRDWRGGGRASARETAARVAAGAIARRVVPEIGIRAFLVELGGDRIEGFDEEAIDSNPFWCPDPAAAERWSGAIETARREGSSLGAIVECRIRNVPAGLGAPVHARLDAELGAALLSINAVKGVEIGDGFAAARARGEDHADSMAPGPDGPYYRSNHDGGISGGIATGQEIVLRAAFKPTSSIGKARETVNREGEAIRIEGRGRHDPCVGIRGVAVVEAMAALVLADHMLLHRAQCG